MAPETSTIQKIKDTLGLNEEDYLAFRKMLALPGFMNSTYDEVLNEMSTSVLGEVLVTANEENWLVTVNIVETLSVGRTGGVVETYTPYFRSKILETITPDEMLSFLDEIITQNEDIVHTQNFDDLVHHALLSYARALKYTIQEMPVAGIASVLDYITVLQSAIMNINTIEVTTFINDDDRKILSCLFNGAKLHQDSH